MNAVTAQEIMAQNRREVGSQATSIEQSRAIAEVQAAVIMAKRFPRDETTALNKALESCRTWEVAEGSFYRFKRGGEIVSDATIHLAVELARCWGNINYGIAELGRDDHEKVSEMLAFACDLETNTRHEMKFLVPHKRDTKNGVRLLTDMRDIYENNSNNGARRLRECIFRLMPPYLKERAKQVCRETLERGEGDKPLQVRIADAIAAFDAIGISRDRIEAKIGRVTSWTATDVANLQVSYRSISRQEVTADEEFPRVATEDVASAARRISDAAKAKPNDGTLAADNPDAGEGRGDEDMGEAHVEDGLSPSQSKARDLIARAEAAANLIDLETVESEADSHLSFMDEETAAGVRAAFDAAHRRISKR